MRGIKTWPHPPSESGGVLNNIVMSRLYRAGSVAFVSISGGMSNELNNTISRSSSAVFEVLPLVEKEILDVFFFFGDHMFPYHDALGAKILLFWARSVVRIEDVESDKITKPAKVCWHMCMLFLLLRFNLVLRALKFEVIWKPLHLKTRTYM